MTELLCMYCGNTNLRCLEHSLGISTYECCRCHAQFRVDVDELMESDRTVFNHEGVWPVSRGDSDNSIRIQNYLLEVCPEYRKELKDGFISRFLDCFYLFNYMNNHGNVPHFSEFLDDCPSFVGDIVKGGDTLQNFFDDEIENMGGISDEDDYFGTLYKAYQVLRRKYPLYVKTKNRKKKGLLRRRH